MSCKYFRYGWYSDGETEFKLMWCMSHNMFAESSDELGCKCCTEYDEEG